MPSTYTGVSTFSLPASLSGGVVPKDDLGEQSTTLTDLPRHLRRVLNGGVRRMRRRCGFLLCTGLMPIAVGCQATERLDSMLERARRQGASDVVAVIPGAVQRVQAEAESVNSFMAENLKMTITLTFLLSSIADVAGNTDKQISALSEQRLTEDDRHRLARLQKLKMVMKDNTGPLLELVLKSQETTINQYKQQSNAVYAVLIEERHSLRQALDSPVGSSEHDRALAAAARHGEKAQSLMNARQQLVNRSMKRINDAIEVISVKEDMDPEQLAHMCKEARDVLSDIRPQ